MRYVLRVLRHLLPTYLYPLYTDCMSIAASSFAQSFRKLNPLPKAWILVAAACCRDELVRLLSVPLVLALLSPPKAAAESTIDGSCAVLILLIAGVDTFR